MNSTFTSATSANLCTHIAKPHFRNAIAHRADAKNIRLFLVVFGNPHAGPVHSLFKDVLREWEIGRWRRRSGISMV